MDVPYDLNKVKEGDKNAFRSFFGYFYPKLMALAAGCLCVVLGEKTSDRSRRHSFLLV